MDIIGITHEKNTNDVVRVAGYCRVSSDKEEQLHSLASQIMYFREYANENPGCQLIEVYADEGITGTSINKRDNFLRMVSDCKAGKIDRIVTKSVSRFARNNEELLTIIRELKSIGVSVFFEKEKIDTEYMSSEFMVSIFGMQAQQESRNISDNMRWSYKTRMQRGEFNTCKPPYGYKIVDGHLEIVEDEAKVVRDIFSMYLSGIGYSKIAMILNEDGVAKRFGFETWHDTTIKYILTNERYMGSALLQKRYTSDTLPFIEKRNHGEVEKYYVENINEPIISKDDFEIVQELIAERRELINGNETTSVLKGVLRCPECGNAMRRMVIESRPYWCCRKVQEMRSNCSMHKIYEEDIYLAFEKLSAKLYEKRDVIFTSVIGLLKQVAESVGDHRNSILELDSKIKVLTESNYKIAVLRTKNMISNEEYFKRNTEISSSLTDLRVKRQQLVDLDKEDESIGDIEDLQAILNEYGKSDRFNDELFEEIVEKIYVAENGELTFCLLGGIKFTERGIK